MITKKDVKSLGINPLDKWPSLNSLIEIQSQRINAITGEVSEENVITFPAPMKMQNIF
ncbi:MAG: hypothetical protein HOP07_15460 [Bacteriovoracaceae bacterium]|nr:hypothetical protein [Bacteriovoracaceae bacterium]